MSTANKRPQGIMIVSVVGFLLSAFACCGSVSGLAGLATQRFTQDQLKTLQADLPNAGGQANFQEKVFEITEDMMPFQLCFAIFGLMLVVALVGSLAALLAGKAPAPKAVKVVSGLAIGFTLIETSFGLYVQWAMNDAMGDMMGDLSAAGPSAMPAFEGIMGASMAMGVCFALVWTGMKLAYYIGTVIYLSKEEVLRNYAAAADAPLSVRGE